MLGFSAREIVDIVQAVGSCTTLNLIILGSLIYMFRRHTNLLHQIDKTLNGTEKK